MRKSAFIAGISLIIMAFAAFFSYGYVHACLVVQGDTTATFHNITSSKMLFTAEITGWIIILIADLVVSWTLYLFLKPIHKGLSLLSAWLRLIYTAILGIAILNLIFASTSSDSSEMMLFLQTFESIWSIGLIVFGGHLIIVGYVVFKSKNIPTILGIFLILGGIGYAAINISKTLLLQDNLAILTTIFSIPMIVGELGFGVWLLVKGRKVPTVN
jgi:hypothetical protein